MKKIILVLIMLFTLTTITSCTIIHDDPKIEYKIKITLDAKKPSVSSADGATWYKVSVKNSSDLQYVITTIEITDKDYQDAKYVLVVNGTKVDEKKYTVKDNVITYRVDDPNWSDYF